MAHIHLALDQFLIEQALRRLLPRSQTEIRFVAVLERHQADSQVNLAASDDIGSDRDRNAVDEYGRRRNRQQKGNRLEEA
jgi:hypothetical protein